MLDTSSHRDQRPLGRYPPVSNTYQKISRSGKIATLSKRNKYATDISIRRGIRGWNVTAFALKKLHSNNTTRAFDTLDEACIFACAFLVRHKAEPISLSTQYDPSGERVLYDNRIALSIAIFTEQEGFSVKSCKSIKSRYLDYGTFKSITLAHKAACSIQVRTGFRHIDLFRISYAEFQAKDRVRTYINAELESAEKRDEEMREDLRRDKTCGD